MEDLYEYLEYELEMTSPESVLKKISSLEYEGLDNLIVSLFQKIPVEKSKNKGSVFEFRPNSTLSGGKYPCSDLYCRLNRLEELMRFSSLYADKVYIVSPIDKYMELLENGLEIDAYELAVDIIILLELKPLVINNIFKFQSEYICLCSNCSSKFHRKKEMLKKDMDDCFKSLVIECSTKIECKLSIKEDIELYIFNAEEYGYNHKTVMSFKYYIPDNILGKLGTLKSDEVSLNPDDILALDIPNFLLNKAYEDVFGKFIYDNDSKISYLTDREVDYTLLSYANGQTENNLHLLDHSLSIIPDVSISNIVELRMKEGESFKVYRDKLNKELRKLNNPSKNEIKDLQLDIIQPEINKMNLALKNNKKIFGEQFKRDLVLWGSTISLGMLSGKVTKDMSSIIGAIGGISTLNNLYSTYKEVNSDSDIRNEPFYFLWKLNN